MNRTTKSKKMLMENCLIEYQDGKFYQMTKKVGQKELKPFILVKNHKYGKSQIYEYIAFYNYKTHKMALMSYQSFLYAWFIGDVPVGYDVDHIDGNTLNNDISNLQLLTRKDNLAKRQIQANQYKHSNNIKESE